VHSSVRIGRWALVAILSVLFVFLYAGASFSVTLTAAPASSPPASASSQAEYVILYVLEGFGQDSLKGGSMPTVSRLIKQGAVTWSATGVKPALRLPTMVSCRGTPSTLAGATLGRPVCLTTST
jgi:hypothetical protein